MLEILTTIFEVLKDLLLIAMLVMVITAIVSIIRNKELSALARFGYIIGVLSMSMIIVLLYFFAEKRNKLAWTSTWILVSYVAVVFGLFLIRVSLEA